METGEAIELGTSGLEGSETSGDRLLPEGALDFTGSVVMIGMRLHHRVPLRPSESCQRFAAPPPTSLWLFSGTPEELTHEHSTVIKVMGIP